MVNNISDVKGFKFWGAHIGIKSMRRDLALVYSEMPANVSAVFTRNVVVAEPVKYSREIAKKGKAQALVVNSGNANACTGEQGRQGALAMASTMAECLNIDKDLVMVSSTGIIGRKFPTEKVVQGIKDNVGKLTNRKVAGSFAANAILTTDTFPKEAQSSFDVNGVQVNMAGMAKGSGMIHPNMGTMLAFVFCDINIDQELLDRTFREIVDKSFNMITVDGDTSTNDMAMIMCNGMARNQFIKSEADRGYAQFRLKLEGMCLSLAKNIVSDGEGATKFIEYKVIHADNEQNARQMVRTISDSSLVKTAIYGMDPNFGRIIAAAGRSGVDFDPDKVDLYVGGSNYVQLLKNGNPTNQDLSKVKEIMKNPDVRIMVDLKMGEAEATGWGSDLSIEYVKFNAEYTT